MNLLIIVFQLKNVTISRHLQTKILFLPFSMLGTALKSPPNITFKRSNYEINSDRAHFNKSLLSNMANYPLVLEMQATLYLFFQPYKMQQS